MPTTIIGIDCAVGEENIGVAIGEYDHGICTLSPLPTRVRGSSVTELICSSIKRSTRTLLAVDAPLGWPSALGTALVRHQAGAEIDASPSLLFRRATDRFVKTHLNKQPLDVGADRIARTAKAALDLLNQVRKRTDLPIPLVWNAAFSEEAGAIEVYPAGTLISYGFPSSAYKKENQGAVRQQILSELANCMTLCGNLEAAKKNADTLDAIICVLSGADFLGEQAYSPLNTSEAEKEGWIWVKRM